MKVTHTSGESSRPDGGSFRVFLQTELARRCAKNPQYSLRAFAQQLGIDHSTLSQLLRERRRFTPRTIRLVASRLKLSGEDIDAYVSHERMLGSSPSASLGQVRQLTGDAASVVSDLHHFSILELVRLKGFKPDSRWIARVLGLGVDEVNVSLSRLLRLGLLEMSSAGKWLDRTGDASTSLDGFTHVAIRQLLRQVGKLQAAAIHGVPSSLRDHSSTTFAADTRKLPAAIELIRRFRRELAQCLSSEASADDVYQLEIALFPVTRIQHSPKEKPDGPARSQVSNRLKKT